MNDSGKRRVNGLIEMVDALVRGGAIDQLNKRETKVWLALRVHADNETGICYPSLDTLAALATRGDRANLCKILKSLIGKGFARKVSVGGGTGKSTRYQVTLPRTVVNSTTDADPLDAGNSGQSDHGTVVNSTAQTVVNLTTGTPHITPHKTPHKRGKPRGGAFRGEEQKPASPQAEAAAQHYRRKWEARHKAPCPRSKNEDRLIAELIQATGDHTNATIDAFFATVDPLVIEEAHPLRLLVGPKLHKYLAQAAKAPKRFKTAQMIRDLEGPEASPKPTPPTRPPQVQDTPPVTPAEPAPNVQVDPQPPAPPEPITTPDPRGFVEFWNGWPEGPLKANRDDCRREWDATGAELRTPAILKDMADCGTDFLRLAAPLSMIQAFADRNEAA